jgi:glycosyltransferase involved in cell wall biosynthesis
MVLGKLSMTERHQEAGASNRLRVVIVARFFEPGFRGGGPIRSITEIIRTAPDDVDIVVITKDRDLGVKTPYPGLSGQWTEFAGASVFYLNTRSVAQWISTIRMLRRRRPDVLYLNSFWDPMFTLAPVVGIMVRIVSAEVVLLAPRGELSPGALSIKRRKKGFFLRVWQPLLRSLSPTWHASSPMEAEDIRRRFPTAGVCVAPDPSALPDIALDPGEPHEGPTRLVFVSRISPMKNLALIIDALRGVSTAVQLDVYGPKEDAAYWQRCEELIRRLPAHVAVRYLGALRHDSVAATFNSYDAFAFPTLGENFGHVIAESLSASCPVICSAATAWTAVLRNGGGSVLADGSLESLRRELERYAGMSPLDRIEMKRRAGQAYESWRALPREPHVFDQIRVEPLTRVRHGIHQGAANGRPLPEANNPVRD